jgi:hypothetical protein
MHLQMSEHGVETHIAQAKEFKSVPSASKVMLMLF